jgi:NAD(P)-dependent dehydrogenase (short-subunit alcohol dehydrogenase family)
MGTATTTCAERILEETVPPRNKWMRLALASVGQQRKTKRCPPLPRLDGRRALVTGATNGIGLEIARGLLARGADLILPCRNAEKGARVRDELLRSTGATGRIDLVSMDLEDLRTVRPAAVEIAALAPRLDILIENAGIMARTRSLTPQGHEVTFGTNVLGHFLLRRLLLDAGVLPETRVVMVTGDIYVLQSACTPDYAWSGPLGGLMAYCRSKLGNLWIGAELQQRRPELTVVVVHPGAIDTDLGGKASGLSAWFKRTVMIDSELGAQTPLVCATQEGVQRGGYYHNSLGLMRLHASDPALDRAAGAKLWEVCEQLTRGGGETP